MSIQETQQHSEEPHLARSAGLLSLGNIASRMLGLLREIVIAAIFGASGEVSALRIALQVPNLLYDFLIGGMLSAALVPVLSETLRLRPRAEFVRLVSVLVSVAAVLLAGVMLLLGLGAPLITQLLAGGFADTNPALIPLTTNLIRLMAPALWLLGMSGLLTGVLFALQRFSFPALATAIFNLGVVVAVPLLADRLGVFSVAVGVLIGGLAQLAIMHWDVQRAQVPIRWQINWRHPALGKILRLYAPIAAGLVVMLFQVGLDRRLASGTGDQSIAWMAAATTLQQLPLGLISVAVSLAALPSLSRFFAARDDASFRRTLGRGLRMVLLFIAPAAIGLWLLGEPLTRLLFEHGAFTAEDTEQVVSALNIYVIGMLCAAVDFPLNYAFYARNNTLLPALVGVVSVGIYMLAAFTLLAPLGYLGLVWADTAKQAAHALIMVFFLWRTVGRLGVRLGQGMTQVAVSALLMALVIWLVKWLTTDWWPPNAIGDCLLVMTAGSIGLVVYLTVLTRLGFDELRQVWHRAKSTRIIRRLVG